MFAAGQAHDLAVDLGTANVRVFARGRGLVADEPSVVRVRREPRAIVAIGAQALAAGPDREGSFPVHPLRMGVVWDVESAGWLLSTMLRRAGGLSLMRPVVLACAPSDASPSEVESLREALHRAGAARVTIVPEPLAAAVGIGLDMSSPRAQMIVDIGDGVTDVAVIRDGRVEAASALRIGYSNLRSAVADRLLQEGLGIHSPAALDTLVRRAGAPGAERALAGVREAMTPVAEAMAEAVRAAWERLAPAASCEVSEGGIWLTGGGASLGLLTDAVGRATSIEVHIPPNPLLAVITGASRMAFETARRTPL
jgi:rod shape-determining protein MreB and related proteins